MGNKLGRRRQVVDEKYTRPQGLYNHKDVDHKKLRKLILESKLAPCYPGAEECSTDLEECPICFLYYPSLNRSRCCMKSICTECFLQMKVPNSARPTQCPFCKTANYAVEYRGMKSKEEKGLEQIEEQRVIEAQIRMRQQEIQDDEERMHKRGEISSSSRNVVPADVADVEYSLNAAPSSMSVIETEEVVSSHESCATPMMRPPAPPMLNRTAELCRDDDFDLDLEDIMVMEAIWLSIQESGRQQTLAYVDDPPRQYAVDNHYNSHGIGPQAGPSSSPSGGFACAIAALAELQQTGVESSVNPADENTSAVAVVPSASRFYNREHRDAVNYHPHMKNLTDISIWNRETVDRNDGEWGLNHGTEVPEAGMSYADCIATEDAGTVSSLTQEAEVDEGHGSMRDPIVPESFEEQMMLAMAVSLAESGAVSDGQGASW